MSLVTRLNGQEMQRGLEMAIEEAKAAGIDGSVRFYLAGQKTPTVVSRFGEDVTNKKTNGVGKSDAESCRWVALSALKALQEGAKDRGAIAGGLSRRARCPATAPDTAFSSE